MKIHHIISDRWSPVAFSGKPVEQEKLDALFEAARWAPSSFNAQPWKFMVAPKGGNLYPVLFELLFDTNKQWAITAPVLALSMAEMVPPGRIKENRFAFHDTGMAVANLLAQATASGLMVHQMGGYDAEGAKKVLNLPVRYEPAAMIAIGYKGDPSELPSEIASREKNVRTRLPLSEFVFTRKFSD
ncbi:MAG: nitroreductase family protein [Bacteroidales bacterium]|nr:nitroreductase family protein [Bacteroidales bacterium]